MGAALSDSTLRKKSTRVPASGLVEYMEKASTGELSREEHIARAVGAVGLGYRSPYSYRVGREKIREYARNVFEEHPIYYSEIYAHANGLSQLIASPTFVGLLGIIAQRPLTEGLVVGYDISQMMQTEQRIEYYYPIYAGDELFIEVIFDSFREVAGADIIVTRNEVFNQDNTHCLSGWTTIVARAVEHENSEVRELVEGVMFSERKIL